MRKKEYKVAEQRRAYDLSERFLKFAALIIEIIKKLPANLAGRRIGDQLFRAGTSTGANYEEACGAESKKDFIHKLGITLKELRETYYWLKLIRITKILPDSVTNVAIKESDELIRIIASSINNARSSL